MIWKFLKPVEEKKVEKNTQGVKAIKILGPGGLMPLLNDVESLQEP